MGIKLGRRKIIAIPLRTPKQLGEGNDPDDQYPDVSYCLWTTHAVNTLGATEATVSYDEAQKINDYVYLRMSQSIGSNHWKFVKETTSGSGSTATTTVTTVQAPCGLARARDVVAFARTLSGVTRVVSPRGKSYYLGTGSGGGGGGGGT